MAAARPASARRAGLVKIRATPAIVPRMRPHLTAKDVWPIIQKLPAAERAHLMAMVAALGSSDEVPDAARYAAAPIRPSEFESDDSGLDWEADGWSAP